MTIEFARNVLGISDAAHAETDPYASRLVVTPLTCSLVGSQLPVSVFAGSLAYSLCGPSLTENYYCNFGLNPTYVSTLEAAGLRVAGVDPSGEVRILELAGHPFFMGTLFVPQARSTPAEPHPVVTGFVAAVAGL
jgi:CTP synthase (UTP-ammonia lyase)